jgi:curved DNA-binding protein
MNAYEGLGVSSTANEDEIKKAYRRLALEYHPDRNNTPEAESKFKSASEAYALLGDKQKRGKLDASLHMGNHDGYQNRGDPMFDHFFRNGGFNGGFEDIFGMGAGSRRRQQQPDPKRTASINVSLSLEDAYNGVKRTFRIDDHPVDIYIPPGVQSGEILQARVDSTLDIHISVRVLPHKVFDRKGNDLHTRIDVPLDIAVNGGEMRVGSIGGDTINLRIPSSLNSHAKLRVKGTGMYLSNGTVGNTYYEVRIMIPELDDVQRNLLAGILSKK